MRGLQHLGNQDQLPVMTEGSDQLEADRHAIGGGITTNIDARQTGGINEPCEGAMASRTRLISLSRPGTCRWRHGEVVFLEPLGNADTLPGSKLWHA